MLFMAMFISMSTFATQYYPNSVSTASGSSTYCTGTMNGVYTSTVTMCGFSDGTSGQVVTVTSTWYYGGSVVYTGTPTTATPGTMVFTLPANLFTLFSAGGLHLEITWDLASASLGCLTDGSTGPLDGSDLAIAVNAQPTVAGITSSTYALCTGTPFTLTAGAVTGTGSLISYNWKGPGGYSTTGTSTTAVVTPVSTAGSGVYSVTVTYPGTGCTSTASVTSPSIVVASQPAIAVVTSSPGNTGVCSGGSLTLVTTAIGGTGTPVYTWNGPGVATATSSSAVSPLLTASVIATTTGHFNVSLTFSGTGCNTVSNATAAAYTVAPQATVTGVTSSPTNTTICSGGVLTLAASVTGGAGTANYTWSGPGISPVAGISNPSSLLTASVAATTTGVYSVSITYSGTGCSSAAGVSAATYTVYPQPIAISGTATVCKNAITSLSDATAGGTWSGGNANASIDGSGNVSGISAGTAVFTYALGIGCTNTQAVTVNPLPSVIAGAMNACFGLTTSLSDTLTGGTWASSNTAVATISSAGGVVTGVTPGTTSITYTLPTGCTATTTETVNPLPSAITGTTLLCTTFSTTLSDSLAGGTWSSGSSGTATIGSSSGLLSGIAAGTTKITYTSSAGCKAFIVATVIPSPGAIAGPSFTCLGSFINLSDASTGGTWTSSDTTIAGVGAGSGNLVGVVTGTVSVTYTISNACYVSKIISVNAAPSVIMGPANICVGSGTTLTDSVVTGTWSSSNTTFATVGSASGAVSGLSAGSLSVIYTLPDGCKATSAFTVNPLPAAITGTNKVCVGSFTALTDVTIDGLWSSGDETIATVGTGSGNVVGVAQGTATISYTLLTGCYKTNIVTVNPLPGTISGVTTVCAGLTTTLSNSVTGGTWSSSATGVATVGTGSGTVLGVTAGTAIITYKLSTGCISTITVTVNPLPGVVNGLTKVCVGSTISLSDTSAAGNWTSTGGAITGTDGTVTGVSAGTAVVTYLFGTGCIATKTITVNALPAAISGSATLCSGLATAFSDGTGGGTWSSSDVTIATISTAGNVTGIAPGNAIITYKLGTGCYDTAVLIVNETPGVINGITKMCLGFGTSLSDTTSSGTWSNSLGANATVDGFGNVSSVSVGTATITYSLSTGCKAIRLVTVNANPGSIGGPSAVCVASTIILTDATSGGSWSSTDVTVGVGTGTAGAVTGITQGVATIIYTLGTGCITSATITVNPIPDAISGTLSVCAGSSTALTNDSAAGTWTSGALAIATVDPFGVVSGLVAGTATISYSLVTGCKATAIVTVNALPGVINGATTICATTNSTLTDATTGGTWATSDATVANITGTGLLIGVNAGTATISYTIGTGCARSVIVTVNQMPAAINGPSTVCVGATTVLTDDISPGTWSSSNTAKATIGLISGLVSGVSAGSVTMTYTLLFTGCKTTVPFTVNPVPTGILGTTSLCVNTFTVLTDASGGGTWSSTDPTIASIGAGSGVMTGMAPGVVEIDYAYSTGCMSARNVTINVTPSVITGTSVVCSGLTTSLSDSVSGGIWTSGSTVTATVSSAGTVTGAAAGIVNISYTIGTCKTYIPVTVNGLPAVITGTMKACQGFTSMLSDATLFGAWSSGNTLIATIDPAGIVTGVSAGLDTITYTLSTGCIRTGVFTVNPVPDVIQGATDVCPGFTMSLSDLDLGGTWTSGNTSIATVVASSGLVHGITNGTATIYYSFSTGCVTSAVVTIDPLPSPIIGLSRVCTGSSITLDEAAGGTWTSGNIAVATVDGVTGLVTGGIPGTVVISYTLGTGCYRTTLVTVNAYPSSINGVTNVCTGKTVSLSDGTPGGTWSSGATATATISTAGIVTGVAAGTTNITYTPGTGCFVTTGLTVNPLPPGIIGAGPVCVASTITLSDSLAGGRWTSANAIIASIGSGSGILTGASGGTVNISYTAATGCVITALVTVNALPAAISGTLKVCTGALTILSDATTTGSWSSGNVPVATVGAGSGFVLGVTAGTAVVTYSLTTGCLKTAIVTVNPTPGAINGIPGVCTGSITVLSDTSSGGVWSSGATAIAGVGTGSGIVNGISAGFATIAYTLPAGCRSSVVVSVNQTPTGILGTKTVCTGLSTSLSDAITLGTWSSSAPGIALANLTTGVVLGVSAGTATITYMLSSGCYSTAVVTVNLSPSAISGTTTICSGSSTILSDAVSGGVWGSSSTIIASINPSTGNMTGGTAGSATITYTLGGCKTTTPVVINPLPAVIAGTPNVCSGSSTTLTDAITGGAWSSNNTGVASVGSTSGVIIGGTPGTAIITYTLGTGCQRTTGVTVNAVPVAIAGADVVCVGSSMLISDPTGGGHWSSSNTAVATVGSATAVVTGIAEGTATITFKVASGCIATEVVTVDPVPAPIVGLSYVCDGAIIFLSDATAGGGWHSSNTGIATVDASGNVVTISAGKDTITYILATGCNAKIILTVNPVAGPIAGATSLCAGTTMTLSDPVSGGKWTSGDAAIAAVGSVSGIVSGASAGSATITYTMPGGCYVTYDLTVNPSPSAIIGVTYFCLLTSDTLTDAVSDGTWISGTPAVAPIGLESGVITAVSVGTSVITYTLPAGCFTTTIVTVTALPNPGTINGPSHICLGANVLLNDVPGGGIWSTSDPSIATVNVFGITTGVALGTATISYTVTQFCGTAYTIKPVTVDPLPVAGVITGGTPICIHGETTLSDTVNGGVWSSHNTGIATVSSAGVVTGVSADTVSIRYSVTSACGTAVASKIVTVNPFAPPAPFAIHPDATICSNTEFQNFGTGVPPPAGVQYRWHADNALIHSVSENGQNSLISFPDPGAAVITITADVLGTGCSLTDSFVMDVTNYFSYLPGVSYYLSELVCTDDSVASYQWGYDDVITLDSTLIKGATRQEYYIPDLLLDTRNYWVMTVHFNGCTQKSYYNQPASGVNHLSVNNAGIKIYPNPADSKINIEVTGANTTGDIKAQLFDVVGKNIKGCSLVSGKGSMDVADLAPGVYSVMLSQNGMRIGASTFVKR